MNGAQSLIHTLVSGGVNVCFSNPGTSEMHFVAALDEVPNMKGVLCLEEGVVTGAADGYARMADKPAATLLHLGPGLANGLANLHNAKRAHTPMVNIVGDHATYHRQYDAPLNSDVEGVARPFSGWIRASETSRDVAGDAADAIAAAMAPPGQVATLILPADAAWDRAAGPAEPVAPVGPKKVADEAVKEAAEILRSGEPTILLIGGLAVRERGLMAAAKVAEHTGARLMTNTFNGRMERGAGLPAAERLPYFGEMVVDVFAGVKNLILVGTKAPVAFFAYPGKPGWLVPDECRVTTLATLGEDSVEALEALVEEVGASKTIPPVKELARPERPSGDLDMFSLANAVGALLPEGAIVSDEGNTAGVMLPTTTEAVPRHDWLALTGGAIGQGLPLATGAAMACPDRKVVSFEADGSAMYTFQALWTQARENLDVTTVILSNRSYAILNIELSRVGVEAPGPQALSLLDIGNPNLDFVNLAKGVGIEATRATTADEFCDQFETALSERGPRVIEAVLP